MPPRDRPHLFLEDRGRKEPYTARGGGGGTGPAPPARDRDAHATQLTEQLADAVAAARAATAEQPSDVTPDSAASVPGMYLEFAVATGPHTDDALGSLENQTQGIELVAVRPPPQDTTAETIATVFVPEGKANFFEGRIETYRTEDTKAGRPRHEALVASITAVRPGTPRSAFTDPEDTFPQDEERATWWELWVRKGCDAQIDAEARRLEIAVQPHVVQFVERDVKVVRASVAQLARLMARTGGVAELRLAKDTPAFFMRESAVDQRAWVDDLLSRVALRTGPDDTAVAVCLLDGGVARGHPLLAPHVAAADVQAVEPDWGGAEDPGAAHAGHGTGMAGLALYGDLVAAMAASAAVEVPYLVESVKILPPTGANAPKAYGAITIQAISRAEAQAPHRHRIVCTAVTSPDSGQGGRPSAWSAALDRAAYDAVGTPRLIVVSAGNIREREVTWTGDYLERNDLREVESPAQAWNVLTVGAYTDKVTITDASLTGWNAVAPAGDLSPSSRTGLAWFPEWPIKPDVVLEGGNYGHDGGPRIDTFDDLQLLTTNYQLAQRLLTTFGDTSAAAALGANFAARVAAARPEMWPETVRALVVHSAEWTPAMLARVNAEAPGSRKRLLLRRYGYGVPDLGRAVRSATNDLTLVIEGTMQPFRREKSDIKTREMAIHELPWPVDVLQAMGGAEVELRVTLSYFIEPNPGERGWIERHQYASHGFRFDVKRPLESDQTFHSRLSAAIKAPPDQLADRTSGSEGWVLGPNARRHGSIHSDVWRGTAADLARRGSIGVYPVGGWWRELKRHARYDRAARYALVASIRAPEQDVDIYTPVELAVEVVSRVDVSIGAGP